MKFKTALYRELLRQQRVCGVVFAILGALTICGTLIVCAVGDTAVMNVPLLINPYAYFLMLVGGIAFPLNAFSYLNKRNSADIYHSMPASRLELFFATAASSLTWIAALQLATFALSVVGLALTGVKVSLVQALCGFLNFTAGSFAVSAGSMIAAAVSGSMLSALSASLVINFVPRLFMSAAAANIMGRNGILALDAIPLLAPQYNFAFGSSMGLLVNAAVPRSSESNLQHMLDAWFPIGAPFFYTMLLGVLLTAAAAWLFVRRKSETAGGAAVSPLWQHIIRCGVASPLLMAMMFLYALEHRYELRQAYFWIILLAAFGVYVIYELISRRSFVKTVKTIPLFALVTLVMLGSAPLFVKMGDAAIQKTVSADQIKTVCFDGNTGMYPMDNAYSRAKSGRLSFDQPEIKKIVAESLSNTVGSGGANSYLNGQPTVTLRAKMKTTKGTFTRYIRVSSATLTRITDITSQDERAVKAASALPEYRDLYQMRIDLNGAANFSEKNDAFKEQVWNTLCEEYLALTPQQKCEFMRNMSEESYLYPDVEILETDEYTNVRTSSSKFRLATVRVYGVRGGRNYCLQFGINDLLPQTLKQIYIDFDQDIALREEEANRLRGYEQNDYLDWQFSYNAPNDNVVMILSPYRIGFDVQEGEDILTVLQEKGFAVLPEGTSLIDAAFEHKNQEVKELIASDKSLLELADLLTDERYTYPNPQNGYFTLFVNGVTQEGDSWQIERTFSIR